MAAASWKSEVFSYTQTAVFQCYLYFTDQNSRRKDHVFRFFHLPDVVWSSNFCWGIPLDNDVDWWRHEVDDRTLSENGFWSVNYTIVPWSQWWRNPSSPFVKGYCPSFSFTLYIEVEIPGTDVHSTPLRSKYVEKSLLTKGCVNLSWR